ncbi:MAG TPA: VOC family protein, partial [Chthoniobacterales bacterium]|nr:VOC family protein [Chthoniobacterales bacterium]
ERKNTMQVDGITWHALTLEPAQFAATKKLVTETFGLTPMMEMEGVSVFSMPNGTILELYLPQAVPPFGYNNAVAFGFRVDDIEAASREVAQAGCELLGQITRVEELGYAYRHFRGPDGRVYGLNEQKAPTAK